MCRLYGFRANEPTKVECALVLAQNSLLAQSREDLGGRAHPDGWGIAYYENGAPHVERRATAAFEDLRFSVTAERVFARAVVAHVRKATVGATLRANTHPYVYGTWSFAHNGTVPAFDQLRERLSERTAPHFRPLRQGTNDSEAIFYWLLTRLSEAGVPVEAVASGEMRSDPIQLMGAMRSAVIDLVDACRKEEPEAIPKLNFLITDGRTMVASRLNRDLHWLERDGVHDCEICGTPHIHHDEAAPYRAVVLSSEPITDEAWQEVPEASIVAVDEGLTVHVEPLRVPGPERSGRPDSRGGDQVALSRRSA